MPHNYIYFEIGNKFNKSNTTLVVWSNWRVNSLPKAPYFRFNCQSFTNFMQMYPSMEYASKK